MIHNITTHIYRKLTNITYTGNLIHHSHVTTQKIIHHSHVTTQNITCTEKIIPHYYLYKKIIHHSHVTTQNITCTGKIIPHSHIITCTKK